MSENESTTQDTEGEMREVTRLLFGEHRPPPASTSAIEDRPITPERRNLRRLFHNPVPTDTDPDPEENS